MEIALNESQRAFDKIWKYLKEVSLPVSCWGPGSVHSQVLKLVTDELADFATTVAFATRDPLGGRLVVLTDRYALDGGGNIIIHEQAQGKEILIRAPPYGTCTATTQTFTAKMGRSLCEIYSIVIEGSNTWTQKSSQGTTSDPVGNSRKASAVKHKKHYRGSLKQHPQS